MNDVLGRPIGLIFKGEGRFGTTYRSHIQGNDRVKNLLEFLTLEYGIDRLSRNVGKELPLQVEEGQLLEIKVYEL